MKKILFSALVAIMPAGMFAQEVSSAVNAYQLSQSDLRGTARFMSMGGAFGALGGDLSTLNQNPGGIGVYRGSDIGLTLDFDFMSSKVDGVSTSNTHVYCNNFGYVGSIRLQNDVMPYFQWGVSYGRRVSFDRTYSGGYGSLGTSLSNYIANFSNGYDPKDLGQSNSYNPYSQSTADWMSILAYNSYIINPVGSTSNYNGLFDEDRTVGSAQYSVRQRGYVDEYSLNFGGNVMNTLYWGIGFGFTDIGLREETHYDEELTDARIADMNAPEGSTRRGNAYYDLGNYRHVDGSGFNFKVGAILKPINELRLGIAVHTPTYYNLTEKYEGSIYYDYSKDSGIDPNPGTAYTDYGYYDWKLRTPWKLIFSAATVLNGRFILSADYQLDAYSNMQVKNFEGVESKYVNEDIKAYYKNTSTIRVGAEYRVTPQFSLRAGFANTSSGVKNEANNGDIEVITSGTNPAYTFDTTTRYITCGLGYRIGGFYVDAAYVNKYRKSTYHPFTSYEDAIGWVYGPYTDFTTTDNNLVLTLGYKF